MTTVFGQTSISGLIDEITMASGSISLDGSSYLTVPSNSVFAFGTNDFTIEMWVYANNNSQNAGLFQISSSASYVQSTSGNQLSIQIYSGYFNFGTNAAFNQGNGIASCAYVANTWYHVAITRQNGSIKFFINGTQVLSSVSDSTNYTGTYLVVGGFYTLPTYVLNGYISNFRVVTGRALYTSNFTPSPSPALPVTNTALLLSVQLNDPFKDTSTNNFAITKGGTPTFNNIGPFNTAPPSTGTSKNIPMKQLKDGTVMLSGYYDECGPNYVTPGANLPGLYKTTYVGYFSDTPTWFATATPGAYGANPATEVQTTVIQEPATDDGSNFSCQWLGYFLPSTTETYTFYTSSDDGSYMWIGPNALSPTTSNATVSNGGAHGQTEVSGTAALTAGVYYPIRIQFGEISGGDVMTFNYSTPTITKTTTVTGRVFYNPATNGF